jgi:hypothetical protein
MLLEDHKRRVARLLRGERQTTDLDRLFADLRMSNPGRASVQEIGHFAAHRGERDIGISHGRANAIQTSARIWYRQIDGIQPSINDLRDAGLANLSIMPDEQIRMKLGISHQTAQQSFTKGINKLEAGQRLKARELEIVNLFGFSMMWQFAFEESTLLSDFMYLLIIEGSLSASVKPQFENLSKFVSLYALAIMHGAKLKMADGKMTQLRLDISETDGLLRIKADIPISTVSKPLTVSVPLFVTSLPAATYCDPILLASRHNPIPAEVNGERLAALA